MKRIVSKLLVLISLACFSVTAFAQVTIEWTHLKGVSAYFTYKRSAGSIVGGTRGKYFRVTSGSGYIFLDATLDATGESTRTRVWVEEGQIYAAEISIDFAGSPRLRDATSGEVCFSVEFDSDAASVSHDVAFYAPFEPFPSTLGHWCPRAPAVSADQGDEYRLNASDGAYADRVRVTWNEMTGATHYEVFRCDDGSESSCGAPIGSPVGNGFNDTGGDDEVTYMYRVRFCASGVCGALSDPDGGYRSDGIDNHGNSCETATPVAVNSTTPGVIDKLDSGRSDHDYFRIYLHADGKLTVKTTGSTDTFGTLRDNDCNDITGDNDSGEGENFQIRKTLAAGTYHVLVRGDFRDYGPYNFVSSFEGPPVPPPAVPTGVAASDGTYSDRVRVSYDSVFGANVYRIFRCPDMLQSSCGSPLGSSKKTSFDDRGAVPGTVYYYRVHACNESGCSGLSAADSGFANNIPPAPTGVAASDGTYEDQTRIEWSSPEVAVAYRVFRCKDQNIGSCGSAIGFSNSSPYDDLKGAEGTKYWYRVKACSAGMCSDHSAADEGYRGQLPEDQVSVPANRFVSFDNDDRDDVILRHRTTGLWQINFMNWRTVRPNSGPTPIFDNLNWEMMGTGDFDGDGRGDVLLRNKSGGGWWLFLMNGRSRTAGATVLFKNRDWVMAGIDDFDGDGMDDVLLRHRVTGRWHISFMNAREVGPESGMVPMFPESEWEIKGTGDFNNDGKADVLLRNRDTGAWWIYLLNGRVVNSAATAITQDTDWLIAGVDDFDRDGKDDVLLRHKLTGAWQIDFMNWRIVRPNSGATPMIKNPDWEIMGTGDFNGDGRADVLLRNKKTGVWWIYLMYGRVANRGETMMTEDLDWVVSRYDGLTGD